MRFETTVERLNPVQWRKPEAGDANKHEEIPALRVLFVLRDRLIRAGLTRLAESDAAISNVASCGSISEAVELLQSNPIDVICVEFALGGIHHGLDLMPAARAVGFTGAFVIIGSDLHKAEALHALRQGAAAIVLTCDEPSTLLAAIKKARQGGFWIPDVYMKAAIAALAPINKHTLTFSSQERAVLRGLVEGATNKELAGQLAISESAVKSTLQNLFRKTGTRTRSHLTRIVIEQYSGEFDRFREPTRED
jgi:two-component system, NarL family, nitrate/nitrite response regulator NarL